MLLYYILFVFPFMALASALLYLPYALYSRCRYGKQSIFFHLPKYALLGYVLSLIYLTILWYYPNITFHPDHYFLNLRPFVWITECYAMGFQKMVMQLLLNIAMFVPYGFLLPAASRKVRRGWKTALAVLLTTVSIETLQYFMGRSADIDDVIMNFTGGIAGYCLFLCFRRLFRGKKWWHTMLGA